MLWAPSHSSGPGRMPSCMTFPWHVRSLCSCTAARSRRAACCLLFSLFGPDDTVASMFNSIAQRLLFRTYFCHIPFRCSWKRDHKGWHCLFSCIMPHNSCVSSCFWYFFSSWFETPCNLSLAAACSMHGHGLGMSSCLSPCTSGASRRFHHAHCHWPALSAAPARTEPTRLATESRTTTRPALPVSVFSKSSRDELEPSVR